MLLMLYLACIHRFFGDLDLINHESVCLLMIECLICKYDTSFGRFQAYS